MIKKCRWGKDANTIMVMSWMSSVIHGKQNSNWPVHFLVLPHKELQSSSASTATTVPVVLASMIFGIYHIEPSLTDTVKLQFALLGKRGLLASSKVTNLLQEMLIHSVFLTV